MFTDIPKQWVIFKVKDIQMVQHWKDSCHIEYLRITHALVFLCYFRSTEVDRNSQLRTRAMRERDEKNTIRIYRFTLLRVKFPDGYVLQG